MELKDYQATVLGDLSSYLDTLLACKGHLPTAFARFWQERGVLNQAYRNNVAEVPHVCVKVPTAGGKTFIAVNALERIFAAFAEYNPTRPKFVVWLVPSLTILEQTARNLADIDHPYRQRLNEQFQGRVQVYEKADVLQGAGFNADTVKEQLSIVVMSYDSLRTANKEGRKAYQENGYLASFLHEDAEPVAPLAETDPSALINVIRRLRPVVIVDESHNAAGVLAVDMLRNLNPAFILDLTATPRDNSNIISYVDALALKKKNMVKLPVIVANQPGQEEVINAALNLRRQLEAFADQAEVNGGGYVRPIVLFQAEPKNREDTTTFEKVKETLLSLNIPPEHIAIKTAALNELKGVDLMRRDCPVRYIITVNALKEGWDCPFAYILATLANKSSVVDVTQILGRVLRMPYTRPHPAELLNYSFVFTASSQFQATLNQVVAGLNKAGFSQRDYRDIDLAGQPVQAPAAPPAQPGLLPPEAPAGTGDGFNLDPGRLNANWEIEALAAAQATAAPASAAVASGDLGSSPDSVEAIKAQARSEGATYLQQAAQHAGDVLPEELRAHLNEHRMKPVFEASARAIRLPQFFSKVREDKGFFGAEEHWELLSKEHLLDHFVLANLNAEVNFAAIDADYYKVDLEESGNGESTLAFTPLKKLEKEKLNQVIRSQSPAGQVVSIVARLFGIFGNNTFYPIEDNDIRCYLTRIVEAMSPEQRHDCLDRDYAYAKVIKEKIQDLASSYAAKEFRQRLTIGKVASRPAFTLPPSITPASNGPDIAKRLYVTEGAMNGLESKVIGAIAGLPNVVWWHRNLDRAKGFFINGYINHYPDFIVLTANNNVLLIETKGDDRDNSDSENKLKLGQTWAAQANQISHQTGYRYHYLMVFESEAMPGAYSLGDAVRLAEQL